MTGRAAALRGGPPAARRPPRSAPSLPAGCSGGQHVHPAPRTRPGARAPVPSELRARPSRLQPQGGEEGAAGGGRSRRGRGRRGNNASLFSARGPTHMTRPAAPRVSAGAARAPVLRAGRVGARPAARPARAPERGRRPPSPRPACRGPRYGSPDAPIRARPRLAPSPSPGAGLPAPRGGVGIKGPRSPSGAETATGPTPGPRARSFRSARRPPPPSVPFPGTQTPTRLRGSLARGRGARAPPPPRTQTAVPQDVAALHFSFLY